MRLLAIILFCLTIPTTILSQESGANYLFKQISTEDGLSNNVIYDVKQDSDGYIWVATDNGLNRYDGYEVRSYFHKNTDTTSLSSNLVRCIIEDTSKTLWVGTKNGLNKFNRELKSFDKIDTPLKELINSEIVKMRLDSHGNIWINTLNDIGYLNPKTLHFELVYNSNTNSYLTLAKDGAWILNLNGELFFYAYQQKTTTKITQDESLISKAMGYSWLTNDLWLPYEFNIDLDEVAYENLPQLPRGLIPNTFFEDSPSSIWIGTNNGLFNYNRQSKTLINVPLDQSVLSSQIRSINKDNQGGLWVGTLNGVYHYDPFRKVFEHLELQENSSDVIMGLEGSNDGIYINSLGKGLYYKDFNTSRLDTVKFAETFPKEGLFIWDIEEVNENDHPLWLATNTGLICYKPSDNSFNEIRPALNGLDQNISFSIYNTDENHLWFSTLKALHKIHKPTSRIISTHDFSGLIKYKGIQKILLVDEHIYIATDGDGLFQFNTKTEAITELRINYSDGQLQPFKTSVWDLHPVKKGLLIASSQGLYSYTPNNGYILPILEDNEVIFSLTSDDSNIIWMGTDNGIKSYDPTTNTIRAYSSNYGLKNKEFNRKSVAKTSDGQLLFGGINGITKFNPKYINKNNPNAPFVHITGLKVITSDSTFYVPKFNGRITLPWKSNTIEIEYVGLNYTNSRQNKYKYILEGHDPGWVNNNEPSKARYVKLPVGTYNFKVNAANNDGVWNGNEQSLEIKISPPFWRTNVAYALYALSVIALISLFSRLRTYSQRIRTVELEKEEIAKKVEEEAIVLNNKSKIYLNELKYIKSDGNYLEFVTVSQKIIDRNKIKAVLEILPPNFVKVHRSYIINKNFISSINSSSVVLRPAITIPLSRLFKKNLTL